ncbi:hypothetical protein LINPERHAP2_LOCUS17394, partial [Linum perenne]
MATQNRFIPDLSKLEALDGSNYKRWSQRVLIFLEQIEVDYVLFSDPPSGVTLTPVTSSETVTDAAATKTGSTTSIATAKATDDAQKFEKDNRTARGHILSHMINPIFDLLVNNKSSKSIWETLQKKYGGDDAGKKKYVVGAWLKFQMTDDKPIMDQVHQFENLTADVLAEEMHMCEILQANVLIEKLPESWSNYRNHLKHKK